MPVTFDVYNTLTGNTVMLKCPYGHIGEFTSKDGAANKYSAAQNGDSTKTQITCLTCERTFLNIVRVWTTTYIDMVYSTQSTSALTETSTSVFSKYRWRTAPSLQFVVERQP